MAFKFIEKEKLTVVRSRFPQNLPLIICHCCYAKPIVLCRFRCGRRCGCFDCEKGIFEFLTLLSLAISVLELQELANAKGTAEGKKKRFPVIEL